MGETEVIVARDTGDTGDTGATEAIVTDSKSDDDDNDGSAATSGDHSIFKIVGPDDSVEVCSCGKEKTVSRTVYAKMVCDTDLVADATKTGKATGIENMYARCWDCQCSYNGSQQQMLPPAGPPQQMLPPAGPPQMAAPQMQMLPPAGPPQQMLPPAGPPQMAAPQMQMQMLAPQYMLPPASEGHKWCMASVPVMVMTGNGPRFLMQQNFVLVRC